MFCFSVSWKNGFSFLCNSPFLILRFNTVSFLLLSFFFWCIQEKYFWWKWWRTIFCILFLFSWFLKRHFVCENIRCIFHYSWNCLNPFLSPLFLFLFSPFMFQFFLSTFFLFFLFHHCCLCSLFPFISTSFSLLFLFSLFSFLSFFCMSCFLICFFCLLFSIKKQRFLCFLFCWLFKNLIYVPCFFLSFSVSWKNGFSFCFTLLFFDSSFLLCFSSLLHFYESQKNVVAFLEKRRKNYIFCFWTSLFPPLVHPLSICSLFFLFLFLVSFTFLSLSSFCWSLYYLCVSWCQILCKKMYLFELLQNSLFLSSLFHQNLSFLCFLFLLGLSQTNFFHVLFFCLLKNGFSLCLTLLFFWFFL